MNRFPTLATNFLVATGLAILPVSVFAQTAQTGTPATTDTKPSVSAPAKVVTHDAKLAPTKDSAMAKDPAAAKDTGKTDGTKVTTSHPSATAPVTGTVGPASGATKTNSHGAS